MKRVLSARHVTTRVGHQCWGCGREFPKKTKMFLVEAVEEDDGKWWRTYWCSVCQAYCSDNVQPDDQVGLGELRSNDLDNWENIRAKTEEQTTDEQEKSPEDQQEQVSSS